MQLTNAPTKEQFPYIELAIRPNRLARYLPAAENDPRVAFRYYLWNAALCESFHLPLHFSEIVCRNAFHIGLIRRLSDHWYSDKVFNSLLDSRFQSELSAVLIQEAHDHGQNMTGHHIVAGLTFGFWEHLATKRFERFLWAKGLQAIFPCAPSGKTYEDLHKLIEKIRRWRNRIAHHRAIFDKGPMQKYQEALELIRWTCGTTGTWVASASQVPIAISLRPK